MIKMKALRSFGVDGSNEGHIRRGHEFPVANEHRAKELEEHGLAYPIAVQNKMIESPMQAATQPPAQNKAAHSGPLPLAGGETGAETQPLSSPPDHPQRGRRSRRSKDTLDL